MNLLRIGNELSYGGFLLTNGEECHIVPLPEEFETIKQLIDKDNLFNSTFTGVDVLDTRNGEFEKIIRQTDIVETEVFDKGANVKIIVRKSQRQLDQLVIWKVYRRDSFKCRYCGRDDVPLTYDHIMLWEEGGPCTEENGISACRKCNKTRGNMPYIKWLNSEYYNRVYKNLTQEEHQKNYAAAALLHNIKPVLHKRSR